MSRRDAQTLPQRRDTDNLIIGICKSIVRYHLALVRMAYIKDHKQTIKIPKMCGAGTFYAWNTTNRIVTQGA